MTQLLQTEIQTEKRSLKTQVEALSLYEQDILLWVEDTVAKLKAGDFQNLDLENLIEEVESVGISQRSQLLNRLIVLFEHLLKRLYVNSPHNYNGWERTIRTQRTRLTVLLKNAPSLKSKWAENIEAAWHIALKNVRQEYRKTQFPPQWPHDRDLETILESILWTDDDHELD